MSERPESQPRPEEHELPEDLLREAGVHRSRRGPIVAAAAAVVLLGLGAALLLGRSSPPPPAAPPPAAAVSASAPAAPAAPAATPAPLSRRDARALEALGGRPRSSVSSSVSSGEPEPAAGPPLTAAQLSHALASSKRAFASCVSKLGGAAFTKKKVMLTLTIEPTGAVSEAALGNRSLDASALGACLKKVGRQLAFPRFHGAAFAAELPLTLSAAE